MPSHPAARDKFTEEAEKPWQPAPPKISAQMEKEVERMIPPEKTESLYQHRCRRSLRDERGHTLIELLIVVSVITIISAYAIFSFNAHKKAFKTDDEALRILNFMQEAGQRSLMLRRVMRLEIDYTDNAIRIIDENGSGTDFIYREEQLLDLSDVRYVKTTTSSNGAPATVSPVGTVSAPPAPSSYSAATFATSTHTLSLGDTVCVLRFQSDGSVLDQGGSVTSATLYLWEPLSTTSLNTVKNNNYVRAITVFGGTGAVRFWKYNGAAFVGS
jgi:prepilin-type N-terminal cleavage/methylation domain-containing protein